MSNAQAYCRNKTTNQNTEERLTNGKVRGKARGTDQWLTGRQSVWKRLEK